MYLYMYTHRKLLRTRFRCNYHCNFVSYYNSNNNFIHLTYYPSCCMPDYFNHSLISHSFRLFNLTKLSIILLKGVLMKERFLPGANEIYNFYEFKSNFNCDDLK